MLSLPSVRRQQGSQQQLLLPTRPRSRPCIYCNVATYLGMAGEEASPTIAGSFLRPSLLLSGAARCALQRYFGAAVGKGRQGAKNEIEKLKLEEMTCREGINAVAKM